jgi:hypothetical protein
MGSGEPLRRSIFFALSSSPLWEGSLRLGLNGVRVRVHVLCACLYGLAIGRILRAGRVIVGSARLVSDEKKTLDSPSLHPTGGELCGMQVFV